MLGYLLGITLVLTALTPFIATEIFADSFTASFDKEQYAVGDSLVLSGEIIDFGMPIIAMSVYDPDGKILSANNLEISNQTTFSKTILLDSSFYEKVGEYRIKLDYGQISQNHNFDVTSKQHTKPEIASEDHSQEPEVILVYTEKKQYTDKDVIKINGLVSSLDSPTVLLGVYDPFGMPAGFYFGVVDSNLEFSTSFLVKAGVNFRVDGTYSIKAHYAETEVTSFFDYHKDPQQVIEDEVKENSDADKPIEDKLQESSSDKTAPDDVVVENTPSNENTINGKEETIVDDSDSVSNHLTVEDSVQEELDSKKNSIIKNDDGDDEKKASVTKIKSSEIKETKIINEKSNPKKISEKPENKKPNHLTVEDVELGKLLNQINLECDSSTFTDTISYYDGMGPALYRLCNFDGSLNFFNESLIDNPNDVEILVNKGSALGKLGYFSEAIVYYDQAIKINPDFLPAKNNKANALANLQNFDDAILLYLKVLQQNPNYTTARNNLETALALAPLSPSTNKIIETSSDFTSNDESENNNDNDNDDLQELSFPEKTSKVQQEKPKLSNFFEEVGFAFSSLGSLFDFLN